MTSPPSGRTLWFRTGGQPAPADPPIRLDLKRPVPVWSVRLTSAVVASGCIALLAGDRTRWVLGYVVVALILFRPAGGAPAGLALLTGLWVIMGDPFPPELFAVMFGVHLVFVLSGLSGPLPWDGRIELSALAPPIRRLLIVQAFAQPLALLARFLAAQDLPVVWFQVAGAVAFAALAWGALGRLRELG
jgi:hypothetical protein